MRWLLPLLLVLAACDSKPNDSHFTAKVSRALQLELGGTAGFWCVTKPLKVCALHLYGKGEDGDSINFMVMHSSRPVVGSYGVDPEIDPMGRSMQVNFISGKKGGGISYVGTAGKIDITESSTTKLKGTFELHGQGTEPQGPDFPLVDIKGEFEAGCELGMRSAYTCE